MDTQTGEIREFESEDQYQQAMHTGTWIELAKMPDPNCKKCYGKGHRGRNTITNLYVPCRYVKKKKKNDSKPETN